MKRIILLFGLLMMMVWSVMAISIVITRLPGGPPTCFEIHVTHDGEPPDPITDFHFSVSMPCSVVEAGGPSGWSLRYALPNSFVEMDAEPGSEISPGESGTFVVCVAGACEDATYDLYLTGPDGVIPGTRRSGPIESLYIGERNVPEGLSLSVHPNPFNSAISIFTPEGAAVEIFGINGRLVYETPVGARHASPLPNGNAVWQPDESVGSGIYLVRATAGDKSVTKRIVYLK